MSYNNYDSGYSNTSYGGGGGGGGGFDPNGSQNSPSGGKREFQQDSMRAVTIKQILEAEPSGNSFNIDGSSITNLTFVGQIRNISSQKTFTTYKLDDGTGSIEVKKWIDSNAAEEVDPVKSRLVEGSYCRAWGKLNSFGDKRHVGVHNIRPVEDMNEVSYHLLEATVVHLHFTRGPPGGAAGAGGAAPQQQNQQLDTSDNYGAANLSGYSSVAKRVFQYMQDAPQTNEGLHQQDIAAKLGVDTADVARAGDDLLSGGLIYTTVDDQTWAILEAE
ncbi:replication protein A, subunit RPA32 [Pleomassaria siparia CBS 279.74]|uniref:Replication protein A, subunit RPA32 n=1 Tax=Pleomassaria siparia CBS 279.74 TaxID=1314801 RepID=A0A6G1K197_9PLEO|nr:replication protein A, subunit RPA32 [Pleomassaria siparia CBS 279.74]